MKPFWISGAISLLLNLGWLGGLLVATNHRAEGFTVILFGGYGIVAGAAVGLSTLIFKQEKWRAACGALAAALLVICVMTALVANHHNVTTRL